jgi:hypothetical protein
VQGRDYPADTPEPAPSPSQKISLLRGITSRMWLTPWTPFSTGLAIPCGQKAGYSRAYKSEEKVHLASLVFSNLVSY